MKISVAEEYICSTGILISSQEKAAAADKFLCAYFYANTSSNQ